MGAFHDGSCSQSENSWVQHFSWTQEERSSTLWNATVMEKDEKCFSDAFVGFSSFISSLNWVSVYVSFQWKNPLFCQIISFPFGRNLSFSHSTRLKSQSMKKEEKKQNRIQLVVKYSPVRQHRSMSVNEGERYSRLLCDKSPMKLCCWVFVWVSLFHLFLINKLCKYSMCNTVSCVILPHTLPHTAPLPSLSVLDFSAHCRLSTFSSSTGQPYSRFVTILFSCLRSYKHCWGIYFLHFNQAEQVFPLWFQSFSFSPSSLISPLFWP